MDTEKNFRRRYHQAPAVRERYTAWAKTRYLTFGLILPTNSLAAPEKHLASLRLASRIAASVECTPAAGINQQSALKIALAFFRLSQ
jgi:hypothetical protein